MTPPHLRTIALAQLKNKYETTYEMSLIDFMISVAECVTDGVSNSDFTDYFVTNGYFDCASDVIAYYDNPDHPMNW